MDSFQGAAYGLKQVVAINPVAGLTLLGRIVAAGELITPLAVVGPVAVELAATVSAVNKSNQRMRRSPSVGPSGHIASDLLDQSERFLIDDGVLCVLKDHPEIIVHIVAVRVLEVLSGLEVHGMAEILTAFQNAYHGRA